jgi:hypothetical protein
MPVERSEQTEVAAVNAEVPIRMSAFDIAGFYNESDEANRA